MLRSWRWGHAAAAWSLVFAGLHLFWAAGGSAGLAGSAGAELAEERPAWFVAFGLCGVAAVLLALAVVGVLLSGTQDGRFRRLVRLVGGAAAAFLLLRGISLQVLLLADPAYGHGAVSPEERHWSLVLWNPWFVAGGILFLAGTLGARRRHRADGRRRGPGALCG